MSTLGTYYVISNKQPLTPYICREQKSRSYARETILFIILFFHIWPATENIAYWIVFFFLTISSLIRIQPPWWISRTDCAYNLEWLVSHTRRIQYTVLGQKRLFYFFNRLIWEKVKLHYSYVRYLLVFYYMSSILYVNLNLYSATIYV